MQQIFSAFLTPYFDEDIELKNIVNDIIGTTEPNKIHDLIKSVISPYIDSDIDKILFLAPSAGAVFGFLLKSGKEIVLKIYNRKNSRVYLEEMNRIQQIFVDEKFPAPHILSPIVPFHDTHAGLYSFIEGEKEDSHDPVIRTELARYLAKFSEIVDKYQFTPIHTFMQESMKGKLWPTPHNILIDLKKSRRGAGWITKKALAARKIINTHKFPKKLAYSDWGVKNTIFNNKNLIGIFDWDSLGAMSEPEMVGHAAGQFTADWESENKITPTPDEARAFVEAYEEYRKHSFDPDEYKVISASADYLIALISRFEHSCTNTSIHPFQDLLKECNGKSLLFA